MAKKAKAAQAISPHAALIYAMVLVAAADRDMTDREFATIGDVIRMLPLFRGLDGAAVPRIAGDCAALLNQDDGLDIALDLIKASLNEKLRESAYALAIEVAAADGTAKQEELRLLEMLRYELEIDRLAAAAIEHGARVRYRLV